MLREPTVTALDTTSIGVMIAAFVGWLPNLAALLSVIWLILRIYETSLSIRKAHQEKNK